MAIGFIGLGNLGTAIAKRLVSMDENVVVWNRSREKIEKPFFSLPATAFTILPFTVFIKSPLIAQSHNFRSVRSYCNSMFKMS